MLIRRYTEKYGIPYYEEFDGVQWGKVMLKQIAGPKDAPFTGHKAYCAHCKGIVHTMSATCPFCKKLIWELMATSPFDYRHKTRTTKATYADLINAASVEIKSGER